MESTLQRASPSFRKAIHCCREVFKQCRFRFTFHRVKMIGWIALVVLLAGLWKASYNWHRNARDEVNPGFQIAGILGQSSTEQGTLRLVFMWTGSSRPIRITCERQTGIGRAFQRLGHRGVGFEVLGLGLEIQPVTVYDHDSIVPPFVVFAVPYWLLLLGAAWWGVRELGLKPRGAGQSDYECV